MPDDDRPLSPHLGVYKWQVSNSMSILHRMTGVFLSIGAIVFVGWLVAVAANQSIYDGMMELICSPFGLLMTLGWTFCFFYHFGNGIRHLVWDAGYGFDPQVARFSGWFVLIVALLVTAGFWLTVVGIAL